METLSPNIYLVEDDAFYKDVVTSSLEKIHFKVKSFTNGADYLRAIKKKQPDLAIIDYNLKDTTGLDLLQKTKAINNAINVVILSAQEKLNIITDTIKNGASYVQKDKTAFAKIKNIARRTAIDVEERVEDRNAMIYRMVFFTLFVLAVITFFVLRAQYPHMFNNRHV